MIVVTVHGRVLSVPAQILRAGIRVIVGGTGAVSGSRRIIPNTVRQSGVTEPRCVWVRMDENVGGWGVYDTYLYT